MDKTMDEELRKSTAHTTATDVEVRKNTKGKATFDDLTQVVFGNTRDKFAEERIGRYKKLIADAVRRVLNRIGSDTGHRFANRFLLACTTTDRYGDEHVTIIGYRWDAVREVAFADILLEHVGGILQESEKLK
jgi:hypothetical protein